MEDRYRGEEWVIEEYPSEKQSGKVSWIFNRGLSVGKKMLVTSFVICSVPLVLPPLVVASIIAFVCSVPSGLLLASYVCTEMLMSKLLPRSKPPPFLLGYGTVSTVEKVENEEGYSCVELKGDIDIGKKEETGHHEDLDKFEGKMDEAPATEIEVTIEDVRKEVEKEPVIKDRNNRPRVVDAVNVVVIDLSGDEISGGIVKEQGAPGFEVETVEVQLCQNTDTGEDEELDRETRGLQEKIRDEGITDTREEDKQSLEQLPGDAEVEEQKGNRNDYGNTQMEKPHRVTGVEESTNNNIPKESPEMKEMKPGEPAEGSTVEIVGTTNVGNTTAEKQREKLAVLQGERTNNDISNNSLQDNQLKRKKEIVMSINADAREIADESGFDLDDSKHAVEGNEISSSNASLETADNTELTVTAREHESDNVSGISSEKDHGIASSEVISEKKVWQQIDAMRKIIGYKVAKQPTCLEELKVLYLFTGVEPPASFKDPSDLQDMNAKLRILTAVVGVK